MLTSLLLLPVVAILAWLYWYLLPNRKWLRSDSLVMLLVLSCASGLVVWISGLSFEGESPLWSYIISATGAYLILTLGLALALAWRRTRRCSG